MSSFLVNLARRGAGLPTTTIQVPPPSPFGPEIHKQGDDLMEVKGAARGLRMAGEPAAEYAASQAPLRASSSEQRLEISPGTPTHHVPSIQRLSGTASSTPIQPSMGEATAITGTPSRDLPAPPRQHVIPPLPEAEVAPMEPPKHLSPAAPPFHTDRAVISEIEVERGRHATSPVAREIEPVGEPARPASSVAPSSPLIVNEPGERQVVSSAELSAEWPRDGAQETREPALPAPTIRPALAESHTLFPFPKVTPASASTPPSQLPIHVRIGRVEVRAPMAPTPTPARSSPPAPLGFDGYYRVRNYRS